MRLILGMLGSYTLLNSRVITLPAHPKTFITRLFCLSTFGILFKGIGNETPEKSSPSFVGYLLGLSECFVSGVGNNAARRAQRKHWLSLFFYIYESLFISQRCRKGNVFTTFYNLMSSIIKINIFLIFQ